MYILNLESIGDFDLNNSCDFVDFWSGYYEDKETKILGTEIKIDYFCELHLDGHLSEENVRRLLRWKDPHRLSHLILSGTNEGKENSKVQSILGILDDINKFRNNNVSESFLLKKVEKIFQTGNVYSGFIFHMAKPYTYPIIDQHVMRACSLHTGHIDNQEWTSYKFYQEYFGEIARGAKITLKKDNLITIKKIDNALMAFGQFLDRYNKIY